MLGAWAKGSLAKKAMRSVPTADARAVAVKTAPLSMPVVLRISGVDRQDIAHREEGRQACQKLGAELVLRGVKAHKTIECLH